MLVDVVSDHGAFIGAVVRGTSPCADDTVLTGGDDTVFAEHQRRQTLLSDFLAN